MSFPEVLVEQIVDWANQMNCAESKTRREQIRWSLPRTPLNEFTSCLDFDEEYGLYDFSNYVRGIDYREDPSISMLIPLNTGLTVDNPPIWWEEKEDDMYHLSSDKLVENNKKGWFLKIVVYIDHMTRYLYVTYDVGLVHSNGMTIEFH